LFIYIPVQLVKNDKNTALLKESLNSDSQQFYQYQQNKQSPLTITHWTQKRPWHMALEIQVLAWDRHKNVEGLNRLIGSQFINWLHWKYIRRPHFNLPKKTVTVNWVLNASGLPDRFIQLTNHTTGRFIK